LDELYLRRAVGHLKSMGIAFDEGLTNDELRELEGRFGLTLPGDLKSWLSHALPTGMGFPAWRGSSAALEPLFKRPEDGLLFALRVNSYWAESWGPRPPKEDEGSTLRALVEAAPRLVPVYGHRYMPSVPAREGNPILSVVGADIVCYGFDLSDYLFREFGVPKPSWGRDRARRIPFWSDLLPDEGT
jgi:hypothetical protein